MLVCCGLRHDGHATVGATSTLTYSRYHHCSARVPFAEAAKFKTTQAEACATKKFAARRENPALRRIVVHFNFLNGVKNFAGKAVGAQSLDAADAQPGSFLDRGNIMIGL